MCASFAGELEFILATKTSVSVLGFYGHRLKAYFVFAGVIGVAIEVGPLDAHEDKEGHWMSGWDASADVRYGGGGSWDGDKLCGQISGEGRGGSTELTQ